jgi:hypothetical protein
MDSSIYQARWLLAPVFGIWIGFLGFAIILG